MSKSSNTIISPTPNFRYLSRVYGINRQRLQRIHQSVSHHDWLEALGIADKRHCPPFYTIRDIATIYQVDKMTISRLLSNNPQLTIYRVGVKMVICCQHLYDALTLKVIQQKLSGS